MKPILIMDMDGTILEKRTVDVLCEYFGLERRLAKIDEISPNLPAYKVAEKVVELFKGKSKKDLEKVFDTIPISDNAELFIKRAEEQGFITSIATDSYDFFAKRLSKRLDVDIVYGQKVEILNGKLTGRLLSKYRCQEIPGCKRYYVCKLWFLRMCKKRYGGFTVTIGDGDSDYCMNVESDYPIAYRPRDDRLARISKLVVKNFDDLLDFEFKFK